MRRRFQLENFNPLRGLDEPRLLAYFDEGERGAYAGLQWLYRFVEKRNATARAVKRRLVSAIEALEWNIKEAKTETPELEAAAKKQAETLRREYDKIKNLNAAIKHLALADLRGFSHVEKIYRRGEDPATAWDIVELRPVEQWFFCRDGVFGAWNYNAEARQGVIRGVELNPRDWLIREIDDPADEIISRVHVRQEVADGDWTDFLEDYGIPPMFIVGPPGVADPNKEAEYQEAAEAAVSAARGYLPNGSSLVTPSATGSGGAPVFSERLKYLEEQIVIAATSGKLTILTESGSGTLAGGAQADAFAEIAQAIARQVAETLQAQFDAAILEREFPGEPVLAYFAFEPVDADDISGIISDAKGLSEAGYKIDAEELSEKTGYQLTDAAGGTAAPANPVSEPPGNQPTLPSIEPAEAPATVTLENDAVKTEVASELAIQARDDVSRALRVTPAFLEPARAVFAELLADAEDDGLSNEELFSRAQELIDSLPELARTADVEDVATALERAMNKALLKSLQG